jgi:exosortase
MPRLALRLELATALVVALWWLPMFAALSVIWTGNEQYSHAWAVPFLSVAMVWLRWQDRPKPLPQEMSGMISWCIGATLLYALMRWLQKASYDWRMLHWYLWVLLVVATLLILRRAGGRPWVLHFLFPSLFTAVAVPWPLGLEQAVIRAMTEGVGEFAVAALNLAGVPALRQGNIIETMNGMVGVTEACSGIRSFQSSLMLALVVGEILRKRTWQRIVLLGGAVIFAFAGNLIRTFLLGWLAAEKGVSQAEAAHDPAGIGVMVFSLFGLWLLCRALPSLSGEGTTPFFVSTTPPAAPSTRPFQALTLGLLLLLVVESSIEFWYQWNERLLVPNAQWSVSRDKIKSAGLRLFNLPQRVISTIGSDHYLSARWSPSPQVEWWIYYFRFEAKRNSEELANVHRPEICLPAAGNTFRRDHGFVSLQLPGGAVPFRLMEFENKGRTLFTLHCVWPDKRGPHETKVGLPDWTVERRFRDSLDGRRALGQRVIQLVVTGISSAKSVQAEAQKLADQVMGSAD